MNVHSRLARNVLLQLSAEGSINQLKLEIMKTHFQNIQKSSNMVDISKIILSDIFYHYAIKFANEHRPFNRSVESQEQWTKAMNLAYADEMKIARNNLFNSIPNKFHKSIMYNKLKSKI